MFGKYFDNRTHQHFVHTYSRVPHLDSQIFDIQTANLRQSRRIKNRTDKAALGLQRARLKSQQLSSGLRESRVKREEENKSFYVDLQRSQQNCLQRQRTSWVNYTAQKSQKKNQQLKNQIYLSDKLKSTSTKAASRLISVRRWD